MRQWAITVGINQYRCLQPLSYAQRDAQSLRSFLVEEAGFFPDRCLLLTDTSPPVWGKPTYPTRENIQGWIHLLSQQYLQAGDILWYFFCGYGVCYQGQDYLVPIEADLTAISTTGISVEALFNQLQELPTEAKLVLLDMNRSQSMVSSEMVGVQTGRLASHAGIPTILSCRPGQFSREASSLGHGFFTAALLESLRSGGSATVGSLDRYLSDRLPELSDHHWRPIQQPLTISPPEKIHQVILSRTVAVEPIWSRPSHATGEQQAAMAGFAAAVDSRNSTAISLDNRLVNTTPTQKNGSAYNHRPLTNPSMNQTSSTVVPIAKGGGNNGSGAAQYLSARAAQPSETLTNGNNGHSDRSVDEFWISGREPSSGSSQSLTMQPISPMPGSEKPSTNGQPAEQPASNFLGQTGGSSSAQPLNLPPANSQASDAQKSAEEISDALFWGPVLRWGGLALSLLFLLVLARHWGAINSQPQGTGGTDAVSKTSGGNNQAKDAATTGGTSSNGSTQAGKDTKANKTSEFNSQNSQTKTTPPDSGNSNSGNSKQLPMTDPGKTQGGSSAPSQLAIAHAKIIPKSDQATPYWNAIQEASKIPPNHPEYQQAQKEIAGWSWNILHIAKQRANQKSFDKAILAARLVPQNPPKFYSETRSLLPQWCRSVSSSSPKNLEHQQRAKGICQERLGG